MDDEMLDDDVELLKKVARTSSTSASASTGAVAAAPVDSAAASDAGATVAADPAGESQEQHSEPEVDSSLLQQLEEMGFPRVRSVKALYYGSGSLEGAVTWLTEHGEDEDIDEPLKISAASKLSYEEKKARLDEILARKKKENAEKQKELEKIQELERIRVNKELMEAKRKQEEQERKRMIEQTQKEKEAAQKERERLRAELEKDKAERAARMGKTPAAAAAAPAKEAADPNAKRLVHVRAALRRLYASCRYPEDAARKAMELAKKIIDNICSNPTEEKFRAVRIANPALQSVLLGKDGGIALLVAVGFSQEEERLILQGEIDAPWLETCSKEIVAAIAKGPFY